MQFININKQNFRGALHTLLVALFIWYFWLRHCRLMYIIHLLFTYLFIYLYRCIAKPNVTCTCTIPDVDGNGVVNTVVTADKVVETSGMFIVMLKLHKSSRQQHV